MQCIKKIVGALILAGHGFLLGFDMAHHGLLHCLRPSQLPTEELLLAAVVMLLVKLHGFLPLVQRPSTSLSLVVSC